jgi:hypothetical protein
MSHEVKIGYKDVFAKQFIDARNIADKYDFDYNHCWVSNNSEKKRLIIKKVGNYHM